ncbi:MAG TPA: pyridoxal-phosphate dependent enzyme [Chloroflexia bacterium]|nr:pyridoxal-phosphate dependent enzyme [Chloroflexia bacterium]
MEPHLPIPLADIYAARDRLAGTVLRTPLIRLNVAEAPAAIFLKLENLQPIGSFKLRGAGNAMQLAAPEELAQGVWTASAGNMAQGVAWYARQLGVPCTVVVPDTAPATKRAAIERLGGRIITVSVDEWLEVFRTHRRAGLVGHFIHAFSDPAVMAGNGTIGLEILEDLPAVDAIVVPYGGGGLSCGIASAVRALQPAVKVYACEVETAAPLAAALAAGAPVAISAQRSFVDGIGSPSVFAPMWPLAQQLLDGALTVTLAEVAAAIRVLAERNRVIAEGAGAAPVAAALAGRAGTGTVVCVVSGGNLDAPTLATILQGALP